MGEIEVGAREVELLSAVVLLSVVVFLARTSHQPASRTLHTCLQKSAGNSAGAECSAAAIKAELVRSSFCLAKRLQVFIVQPDAS